LSWVRQQPQFNRVPFTLLTGSAQQGAPEKPDGAGADFCLEKSVDFNELLARVRKLLPD